MTHSNKTTPKNSELHDLGAGNEPIDRVATDGVNGHIGTNATA